MLKEIFFAGALILASNAAPAQERHRHGGMLERADANQDGMLARDEFLAAREQRFARMDRNSDNVVDEADRSQRAKELAAQRQERRAKLRAQLDPNGDGKISKEEFVNAGAPLFEQADKDGNGVLSEQELKAARGALRQRMHERHQR